MEVVLRLRLLLANPASTLPQVLNKARQAVPTSAEVWITASKLEEANGAGGHWGWVSGWVLRPLSSCSCLSLMSSEAAQGWLMQPPCPRPPLRCRGHAR